MFEISLTFNVHDHINTKRKNKQVIDTALISLFLILTITFSAVFSTNTLSLITLNQIQSSSTEVGGFITTNTTWSLTQSPYIATESVYVEPTVFLTIEPGVVVKFTSGASLVIFGGLIAQGEETQRITFTANSTEPVPGFWESLRYRGTYISVYYVLIEYAAKGLELWNEATISYSNIKNCTVGLCTVGSDGKLNLATNLEIIHCSENGLELTNSQPAEIYKCIISENNGNGINISGSSTITIRNCTISKNSKNGMFLSNGGSILDSSITGNGYNGTCTFGYTTIDNSILSENNGNGIWAGAPISISNSRISRNDENGIYCNHTTGETSIENSTINSNDADGIWTAFDTIIELCEITQNTGDGASGNLVSEGFTFLIESSNVSFNGQSGVTCPANYTAGRIFMNLSKSFIAENNMSGLSGCGYAFNSTISHNKMWGIFGNFTIDKYSFITSNQKGGFNGTGKIYWSSLYNNTLYDVIAQTFPNNITAIDNWWGTINGAEIEARIWDHNDNSSLGWVFFNPWRLTPIQPIDDVAPEFYLISWERTNPGHYIPNPGGFPVNFSRSNEPVHVFANITDNSSPLPSGVDKVLLSYNIDGGEFWNITMIYNETSELWNAIIPGYSISWPGNKTIEFFLETYDEAGNMRSSEIFTYIAIALPPGDLTGDGYTGIDDIVATAEFFGKSWPGS